MSLPRNQSVTDLICLSNSRIRTPWIRRYNTHFPPQVVWARTTLSGWCRTLRSTRTTTSSSGNASRLRTPWRATRTTWSLHRRTRNWRTNWATMTARRLRTSVTRWSHGSTTTRCVWVEIVVVFVMRTVLLLSCPSHNFLPVAGACLCPLCHSGQVVSRAGEGVGHRLWLLAVAIHRHGTVVGSGV